MKINCEILLTYKAEKAARTVFESIEADNFNFVKCKISGKNLISNIESSSISSILHTLDDFLACVSIASKIADKN
jgi:hypothetical protein